MAATVEVLTSPAPEVGPERIMEVAFGFAASKALLSATEIGLFTELAPEPLALETIRKRLGLHPRAVRDFLDTLVALGFLERRKGRYANAPAADLYLDRAKPSYIGGIVEMANARLYGFWGSLTEALRTGKPQNEAKGGGDAFAKLYADPARLRQFLTAMTGLSVLSGKALAGKFPWWDYRTFVDIGCAQGAVPVELVRAHPHLHGAGFDLEPVGPVFEEYVSAAGFGNRVRFLKGDFFKDPLPQADVLIMGHILHDWDLRTKCALLDKAYAALAPGGALIVHEALIDDARSENVFGLLMSLNMLIETPGGFDYTAAACQDWMRKAGFRETWYERLGGADSMAVGIK
ncbi:MAG TPA: methyltransferase [Bryobacteraceae bacterium]